MAKGMRVKRSAVDLDEQSLRTFFAQRSNRYDRHNPLISVLYQDDHPTLARERDAAEKAKLLPLLQLNSNDRVLDVGCGIGRWADVVAAKVSAYHGVDIDSGMITIARERMAHQANATFQVLSAQEIDGDSIVACKPFSLLIMVGVLMYLNDNECYASLQKMAKLLTSDARILIREPVGVDERLTLKDIWSDELKCHYSAIYRTVEELCMMVERALVPQVPELIQCDALYSDRLNNRTETRQQYMIFRLRSGDGEGRWGAEDWLESEGGV